MNDGRAGVAFHRSRLPDRWILASSGEFRRGAAPQNGSKVPCRSRAGASRPSVRPCRAGSPWPSPWPSNGRSGPGNSRRDAWGLPDARPELPIAQGGPPAGRWPSPACAPAPAIDRACSHYPLAAGSLHQRQLRRVVSFVEGCVEQPRAAPQRLQFKKPRDGALQPVANYRVHFSWIVFGGEDILQLGRASQ